MLHDGSEMLGNGIHLREIRKHKFVREKHTTGVNGMKCGSFTILRFVPYNMIRRRRRE
jgi:hypothetical protein